MITTFPIDGMHVVLGVTKRILSFLSAPITGYMPHRDFAAMDRDYDSFKFPVEFSRGSRPLTDYKDFKFTEFRMLLLYGLDIIIRPYISTDGFQTLIMLIAGLRILCDRNMHKEMNELAQNFLTTFVRNSAVLFGEHFVTLKVHLLGHLAAEVDRLGPLESYSAYPFENVLKTIKRSVSSPKNPLVNVTAKLKFQSTYTSRRSKVPYSFQPVLIGKTGTEGLFKSVRICGLYFATSAALDNCSPN